MTAVSIYRREARGYIHIYYPCASLSAARWCAFGSPAASVSLHIFAVSRNLWNICRFIQAPVSMFWLNPSVLCCSRPHHRDVHFFLWKWFTSTCRTVSAFATHFQTSKFRPDVSTLGKLYSQTINMVSIWNLMPHYCQSWKQQHCAQSGKSILKHTNLRRGELTACMNVM